MLHPFYLLGIPQQLLSAEEHAACEAFLSRFEPPENHDADHNRDRQTRDAERVMRSLTNSDADTVTCRTLRRKGARGRRLGKKSV